jgi:hypothetical protein
VNHSDSHSNAALHFSAGHGHLDIVQALLMAGADVDAENRTLRSNIMNTSLHISAHKGHIDKFQALLKAGANVDTITEYGRTALYYAKDNDDAEMEARLRGVGAQVEDEEVETVTCAYCERVMSDMDLTGDTKYAPSMREALLKLVQRPADSNV